MGQHYDVKQISCPKNVKVNKNAILLVNLCFMSTCSFSLTGENKLNTTGQIIEENI
jgi:hypothetical protein